MLLFESLRAETIRFGQTGGVTITPPAGWQVESEKDAFGPANHAVTLVADKSRKPGCTIVIVAGERQPAHTEASFLAYVKDVYVTESKQFVEKDTSFKKLDITNGFGFYSVVRYAAMDGKPPKEGAAKVCGIVMIYRENSPLISANLYVDDTKDPALDLMVKAICDMDVSFQPLAANLVQFSRDDYIKLNIPSGWGTLRGRGPRMPDIDRAYNLTLTPPASVKARFTLSIGNTKTGKPLTKRQFDDMSKTTAGFVIPDSVEKKAAYKDIQVRGGRGIYCVFTDASLVNKKTGPHQYKYAGQFLANYDNGYFAYATVLTDDPNGAEFQLMSKVFASIEPSFGTIVNTPSVQVTKTKDGVLIGNSISNIKLLIPSKSFKQKTVEKGAVGGRGQPSYFWGGDDAAGVTLSGWFELASQFNYEDARQMWTREGLSGEDGVEYKTVNDWDVIVYNMAPKGTPMRQANIRANFLRGDTWIDLHLSTTDMTGKRSLEDMRKALLDYLATLQIVSGKTGGN